MECYKEVEKNSKMKSFSNQSIMLAAKDSGDQVITPEVEEALEFLSGVEEELNDQNESLEEEYEKLSQKKVRKSNMLQIEERKQELEAFKTKNEFHLEKIEGVTRFLKMGRVSVESVWAIQEDLNFYVESNQEPDFVDDDTLYDEIFREAKENSENNTVVSNGHPDESFDLSMNGLEDSESTQSPPDQAPKRKGLASVSPVPELQSQPEIPSALAVVSAATPKNKHTLDKNDAGEATTPGFVTTLKPASAPPKPVGALKWSIAAGGATHAPEVSNGHTSEPSELVAAKQNETPERETKTPVTVAANKQDHGHHRDESNASSELLSLLTKNDEYSPYLEVLKNSSLSLAELDLFSDLNLLRTPPGIQHFAVAFTASNKTSPESKLLLHPQRYSPTAQFLRKPYLPQEYQIDVWSSQAKLPTFLTKLQNYWNRIKAGNQFNQLVREVELLELQKSSESSSMVDELTLVLFYGYYCGFLPLENVIAESLLHRLGWAPYGMTGEEESNPLQTDNLKQFRYWFKQVGASDSAETGDYRVFDLSLWEIHVKYGFKFDARLSKNGPSKSLL